MDLKAMALPALPGLLGGSPAGRLAWALLAARAVDAVRRWDAGYAARARRTVAGRSVRRAAEAEAGLEVRPGKPRA